MVRVNRPAQDVYERLQAANIRLSASQVAKALSDGLGPLPETPDETAHWQAVDRLRVGSSQRMPDADIAAMRLAVDGHPCPRLRDAILRLSDTSSPAGPEDEIQHLAREGRDWEIEKAVDEALALGEVDEKPYAARLTGRFMNNSRAAGPVRPTVDLSPEQVDQEHIGRTQAVLEGFRLKIEGEVTSEALDIGDLAAVTRFPAETVEIAVTQFDQVLGNDWLRGGERYVRQAEPWMLAAAVRAGDAMVPLFEQSAVTVGTGILKWRVVAIAVPIVLTLLGLLPGEGSLPGPPDMTAFMQRVNEIIELLASSEDEEKIFKGDN